jgi:XTP/dITP diphosphohydrolase
MAHAVGKPRRIPAIESARSHSRRSYAPGLSYRISMPGRRLAGRLVVATHNSGKLKEMHDLLAPFGVEAVSAGDLGLAEPDETGTTFAENAAIKAHAAARAAGLPALADDSGICVDALDGAPGIFSARWGGPAKDFAGAMARIDRELSRRGIVEEAKRTAHFVSALVVAWPDGHEELFEGRVFGTLVYPPRGTAGFGYDPMFRPQGDTRTFGELSAEEKHGIVWPAAGAQNERARALSHRARAFVLLAQACLGQD